MQHFKTNCIVSFAIALTLTVAFPRIGPAQVKPSPNAALHYNRALLQLANVPLSSRQILDQSVWQTFGDASKEEIDTVISGLVFEGRHAVRSAMMGSRQARCQFGIDYTDFAVGAIVPHVPLMTQLGRITTYTGIDAQIDGDYPVALECFLTTLRMGNHLVHEPTLVEALAGLEQVENGYYSLAFWATRCPDPKLVANGHKQFLSTIARVPEPWRTMSNEAQIIGQQLDRVISAMPNGPWAEMLLEAWGEYRPGKSEEELETAAIAAGEERGIPRDTFANQESFAKAANEFRNAHVSYYKAAAECMRLAPIDRVRKTMEVYEKYKPIFEQLGDRQIIDIRDVGIHFATSDAERTMATVVFAIASARNDGQYPGSLDSVRAALGGTLPKSPYDGTALEYQTLNDGKDFLLAVPQAQVEDLVLPRIEFSSVRPGRDGSE